MVQIQTKIKKRLAAGIKKYQPVVKKAADKDIN